MITPNTFTATGWAIIVCLGIGIFVWGVVIAPYRQRKAIERRIGEIDAKAEAQASELRDVGIDPAEFERQREEYLFRVQGEVERYYNALAAEHKRHLRELEEIELDLARSGEGEVCDTSACADA